MVANNPTPHSHPHPSLKSRTVSVDVKHHVYLLPTRTPTRTHKTDRVLAPRWPRLLAIYIKNAFKVVANNPTPHSHDDDDDDVVMLNVLGCQVDILGTNCDECVSMVQCCFTSTKNIRLVRMGSPGQPPRLSHSSSTLHSHSSVNMVLNVHRNHKAH